MTEVKIDFEKILRYEYLNIFFFQWEKSLFILINLRGEEDFDLFPGLLLFIFLAITHNIQNTASYCLHFLMSPTKLFGSLAIL